MSQRTTKEIGDFGERCAVHYLRRHGYTVKERNWRAGRAEIDVIAATLFDVAFVEVKTRTYDKDDWKNAPPPSLAVHAEKQRLTRYAARQYLSSHPTKKRPRMDVIEVWLAKDDGAKKPRVLKIHHMKAAY